MAYTGKCEGCGHEWISPTAMLPDQYCPNCGGHCIESNVLPSTAPLLTLAELKQTCMACPSQWEGRTISNEPVYIRYRWGGLSVRKGPPGGDIGSAVSGEHVYSESLGGGWDGCLDTSEMLQATGIQMAQ